MLTLTLAGSALLLPSTPPATLGASRAAVPRMQATTSPWSINEVSPDGALTQRVEGKTRKTWKFNDLSKDRVQVALTSEGRPINAGILHGGLR